MSRPPFATVTVFGSLPHSSKPAGAVATELQSAFVNWMDEGVTWALERGGMRWREAFQRSAPQAFTFRAPTRAKSNSILLGVMSPSEDKYGRPLPFCVMTEMRESAYVAANAALPIAAERFIAEATEVCALARRVSSPSPALEDAERRAAPRFGECVQAANDLREWVLLDGTLGPLWSRLFPTDGASSAAKTLRGLIETVVPMKTHGAIGTCRSLRLPLGHGGGAAASFWVDVIRSLAGWSRSFPAAFWPADRADGDLIVALEEVPVAAFGQLWGERIDDPIVMDATQGPVGDVDEFRRLLGELDRTVSSAEAKIIDLLGLLARFDAR